MELRLAPVKLWGRFSAATSLSPRSPFAEQSPEPMPLFPARRQHVEQHADLKVTEFPSGTTSEA